jgi:hypothetical protein
MADILVAHEEGDRFTISIRVHEITIDQPVEDGGTDKGPPAISIELEPAA